VWPNRSSAMFTSVVGNLDQRVELDKSIRPSDPKYNASLAIMASKLAYENEAFVQTTVKDQWSVTIIYMPKYNSSICLICHLICDDLFSFSFFLDAQMEYLGFDNVFWNGKKQPLYINP
jgi:CTP:phosphocholine cytidylyltransferase-like protein